MPGTPDETYMEQHIVDYLCSQPIVDASGVTTNEMEYRQVSPKDYDKDYCLIPSEVITFLKDTQPKQYKKLLDAKNGNEQDAQKSILDRIKFEMDKALRPAVKADVLNNTNAPQGTLTVLRNKKEFDAGCGAKFQLFYGKPANNKTPEHDEWYRMNRLAVMRQLKYSKKNNNEIDLGIFLNGFPIATLELKNALTNQKHHEAIKQYMEDRNPEGEPFLDFKRCLVHFAVGTEEVYMTTYLNGENTRFFPFNKTLHNYGVVSTSDGYRTSYIWEDVLRRDNLLSLFQNFITVQLSLEKEYNEKTGKFDDKVNEAMIFPRYHQRRAVNRLVDKVTEQGAGHRYLIQHSAGSGKSNTIAWLAFQLSNLYQHPSDDMPLFDSILVVTDRRLLNEQLSRNVKQFSTTAGEVKVISDAKGADGRTSNDLKEAIEAGDRIIVTTIQKFPHISDAIAQFPERKYAVIIDEAHSSSSGENARQMRKTLSLAEAERWDKEEEEANDAQTKLNELIEAEMKRKGNVQNVSFFAFTATPKGKTIELFCEREYHSKDPFDSYTMEEAIKEGFILNVLKGYMSFKRYFKMVRNTGFADKEYETKKAVIVLTRYVDLHDNAIETKSRIMIEHFVSQSQKEIGGKARAMLVTRSRWHAVLYKLKFDNIMEEMHLPYKSLVAFSGTVKDDNTNQEYTESSMNGLEGIKDIAQAFKLPKYRILIVANKFQTGFDEPLLQTMFVDKKLDGANAVQTLSRLNRCCRGKDNTMVLDFVNNPEEIRKAFNDYYGKNKMKEEDETDPNKLYDVKSSLYDFKAFTEEDVDEFSRYFFIDDAEKQKVEIPLDRVCDRVIKMDEDTQVKFRKTCKIFFKLYTFLSQIITFVDADLEKLSAFTFALYKKLPCKKNNIPYNVLKESRLDSYKIKYEGKHDLQLVSGDTYMEGEKPGEATSNPEDKDLLSHIIKKLNDTYGIELTDEDKVDLESMKDRVMNNQELMQFFNSKNSRDDVKSKFDQEIDSELLNFITTNMELYNKLTESTTNLFFKSLWFKEIYDKRVRNIDENTKQFPKYDMPMDMAADSTHP